MVGDDSELESKLGSIVAKALVAGARVVTHSCRHPLEDSVSIPAGKVLYWQYVRALAAVMMRAKGQSISEDFQAILDDAAAWQEAFGAEDECFWTRSEEFDGGGGEDIPMPPYDIDLRELEHWTRPVRDRDRPFTSYVVHLPE